MTTQPRFHTLTDADFADHGNEPVTAPVAYIRRHAGQLTVITTEHTSDADLSRLLRAACTLEEVEALAAVGVPVSTAAPEGGE